MLNYLLVEQKKKKRTKMQYFYINILTNYRYSILKNNHLILLNKVHEFDKGHYFQNLNGYSKEM